VVKRAAILAAVAATACGSFEDPAIVIDLRLLAMVADPPEQLVPFDPSMPPDPGMLPDIELAPTRVCAVIADPAEQRGLEWRMRVCPVGDDLRCEEDRPLMLIGAGVLDDPDTAAVPQEPCAVVPPGPDLIAILYDAIADDPTGGFGGVDIIVELRVGAPGALDRESVFGAKRLRVAVQLPAERTPNTNPTLERIDITINDAAPVPLPAGRCVDQAAPLTVTVDDTIRLDPIEPDGVREDYLVPTFDGGSRMFTENISYQWLAGDGEFQRNTTGGPRDIFGNYPPLDTEWRTPPAEDVSAPIDVPLWIDQRDERLGGAYYLSCLRVMPR
jgi:hypothetical protein